MKLHKDENAFYDETMSYQQTLKTIVFINSFYFSIDIMINKLYNIYKQMFICLLQGAIYASKYKRY